MLAAGALPLLVTRPAPLQDWPSHIARMPILIGLLHGDPFWNHYYRLVGFLVPDAALDLVVLGLSHIGLPVGIAAQLFLIATYLTFVIGFLALGGFKPVKAALVVLLFYNDALFWGLVNYVLGIGVLMALLALWLRSGRHPWWRLCIAGLGGTLLLFTHVVAAMAWITLLGAYGIARRRELGLASCGVALLVVAVLLHALPGGTGHDFSLHYAGAGTVGLIVRKLWLFGKLLLGGSLWQDAASLMALFVCGIALATARPRLAPAPVLAVAALVMMTLAAPERIGTGSVLDTRLAVLPLLLLAAEIRIRPRRIVVGTVMAATLLRTLVLALQWHAAGRVFHDFDRQTARLPGGSVMMVAYGTGLASLSWRQVWSPPLTALHTQAVFHGLFVPAVFANPAQQPIALRPAYRTLNQPWNLTDAPHLHEAALGLAKICAGGGFAGVYLTVLYPGDFAPGGVGGALLHAQPDFLIVDACRLPLELQPGRH